MSENKALGVVNNDSSSDKWSRFVIRFTKTEILEKGARIVH